MNTPKEIAIELIDKFKYAKKYANSANAMSDKLAKQCAIIHCEGVIKVLDEISMKESGTTQIDYGQMEYEEVIQEINKQ
jgi:hypothetical protein